MRTAREPHSRAVCIWYRMDWPAGVAMKMKTKSAPPSASAHEGNGQVVPPLENGDRLDQKTFHERYEATPEGVKAELIGGIVYMASPLKRRHGRPHSMVMGWLSLYEEATPG